MTLSFSAFMAFLSLSIIGGGFLFVHIFKDTAWIFKRLWDCLEAGKNQKMMYEWAHKNQAWCSKNQYDIEDLARRVTALEKPSKGNA